MVQVYFSENFIRLYGKLEPDLKEEIKEKIELFKNPKNHRALKTHKLHGKFNNSYAFSVNYRIRIVFFYTPKKEIILLDVGDHDMYK